MKKLDFGLTDKQVDDSFVSHYKSAFKSMVDFHVRDKKEKQQFLVKLLKLTNEYASSPVWGAVVDLLKEEYGYTDEHINSLI